MMRLIFKTSPVTPDFFYVFNIILSFSNCSQSFKKISTRELLGANVLKSWLTERHKVYPESKASFKLFLVAWSREYCTFSDSSMVSLKSWPWPKYIL